MDFHIFSLPFTLLSFIVSPKRDDMKEESSLVDQWQKWNAEGLIPGPDESEEAFQERIAFCQNLESNLKDLVGTQLPFQTQDPQSKEILEQALPLTQNLYGIQPRWVPLFFGNYQLAPWHGGCAWIFQLNEQTPTSAFLQLRSTFRHASNFLGIYHRRELIAHELAHVGRMLYQEPQFEEFFAYQSSPSRWRRWLGPIVQSSTESFVFILLLGLIIMTDFALLSIGSKMAAVAWWVKLVPLVLIAWALGRLFFRHRTLKRCLQKLEEVLPSLQARHFLYRLRDHEIKHFSTLLPKQIEKFVQEEGKQSFRWRFLKALYFFEETP